MHKQPNARSDMAARMMLVAVVVMLVGGGLTAAQADHGIDPHELRASGKILPLEKFIELARSRHQGHLLEAELLSHKDRFIYEVEILDEGGQVWEMFFDARTGEELKPLEGDSFEAAHH